MQIKASHYKALQTLHVCAAFTDVEQKYTARVGQRLLLSADFPPFVMRTVSSRFFFGALLAAGLASAEPPAAKPVGARPRNDPPTELERARHDDIRFRSPDDGERRHPSRLSPEEKKALRQHINEAGQDLYPEKKGK